MQRRVGQALYAAQCGNEYSSVKALKGFAGRTVLEIVVPDDGNTYRAVYTVRFQDAIYVRACLSKEVEERHRNASNGNRVDPAASRGGGTRSPGKAELT